jgi:CAAX protease family protein
MADVASRRGGVGALLTFFAATFGVTWPCFFAASRLVAPSDAPTASPLAGAVFLLGVFAPSLVALTLTASTGGRPGVEAWLRTIVQPVAARWYVFAVSYLAVIKLTAAVAHRMLAGHWPAFGQTPWYLMAGAIVVSMWAQAGEEIGWRAYALPRLAVRVGLPAGSIVLGVIWACWHLPLFFIFPGADTYGQSFVVYLLQVTAISVAMAWLYWRTRGVLLPVMVMHAAVNNTKDIVPSAVTGASNAMTVSASPIAWITVTLLWIAGVYFLVQMRHATLPEAWSAGGERRPKTTVV